jgi:hypothetical protein
MSNEDINDQLIELAHKRGYLTRNIEVTTKIKQAFNSGLIDSETYITLVNLLSEDK